MWDRQAIEELEQVPWVGHVEYHPTVESTNDLARELVDRSVPLPALVVAGQQTRGRGRQGRRWWSPPGALLCSLVVGPDVGPQQSDALSVMAPWTGIGLAEGLNRIEPALPLWLKWPNDLMVGDCKLGGVLVECVPGGAEGTRWIVGFGVNVNNRRESSRVPPEELDGGYLPLSLIDFSGRSYPLVGILSALLHSLATTYSKLRSDPESLPERWQVYCGLQGRRIEVATRDDRRIAGIGLGIDAAGALRVQTDHGSVVTVLNGTVRSIPG